MKITTCLFYRENHNDKRSNIRFYDSIEQAEREAQRMIEQFKYWGGGSVPELITQTRWTKKGSSTIYRKEYLSSEWISYSRDNGTKYGYYSAQNA